MKRFVSIVDLGILTLIAVAIFLPPREMFAASAYKGDELQFQIALAEARTIANAGDGKSVDDFARRIGAAGFKDWAIEAALDGSVKAVEKNSPDRWRALLATSVAFVDRLDVIPALDYANRSLAACDQARTAELEALKAAGKPETAQTACPSWEEVRMRLYHQHLDAGVKSGINPRVDPKGFREAAENSIRHIRLKSGDKERKP